MYSRCLLVCSNCTSNCDFKHLVTINSQCMTKMVSRCLYHAIHFCRIIALEENSSLNAPVSASQVNHLPSSCRWFGRSPTSLPKGLFQVGQEHKSFAVIRLGLSPFHLYILEINGWFTEKSHNWKETSSWNEWLSLNPNYIHETKWRFIMKLQLEFLKLPFVLFDMWIFQDVSSNSCRSSQGWSELLSFHLRGWLLEDRSFGSIANHLSKCLAYAEKDGFNFFGHIKIWDSFLGV